MSPWRPDSILIQAKIRDKGDALATAAVEYSQSDLPTVQKGLDSFGRTAANVQEYRDAYVSTQRTVQTIYTVLHKECHIKYVTYYM